MEYEEAKAKIVEKLDQEAEEPKVSSTSTT
jgi:hypothetical protein